MFLVDNCYSLLCPDTSNLEECQKKLILALTEITQKIIYNIKKITFFLCKMYKILFAHIYIFLNPSLCLCSHYFVTPIRFYSAKEIYTYNI